MDSVTLCNNELISVIVPVYNVEKYLEKCLNSIINQTYSNLDIILIDDGSTDYSSTICDEYANRDTRIRVIHKDNTGLADARNVGIENCKGNFLIFIDSDDYIDLQMIHKLYLALKRDDSDLCICNFLYVDTNYQSMDNKNGKLPIIDEIINREQALKKLFQSKAWYYVVVWNKLYKKELFNEIRFPYGRLYEDEFIIHRILGQCKKISCIHDCLYFYLQRPDSIMGKGMQNADMYFDRCDFMLDRMFYLKAIDMDSFVAKAYESSVLFYYKAFEISINESQKIQLRERSKRLKKEFREYFSVSKYSGLKIKCRTFLGCFCPKFYELYIHLTNNFKTIHKYFNEKIHYR